MSGRMSTASFYRACWLHYFAEADLEFPMASPIQKSAAGSQQNLPRVDELAGVPINGGALTKCGEIPFSPAKLQLSGCISRLRTLFEPPKMPQKSEILQQKNCGKINLFLANPSSESCSPLGCWKKEITTTARGNRQFFIEFHSAFLPAKTLRRTKKRWDFCGFFPFSTNCSQTFFFFF